MKKSKKRLTVVFVFIIIVLFAVAGCDATQKNSNALLTYAVAYAESGSGSELLYGFDLYGVAFNNANTIALFNSKRELLDFCDEEGIPFFEIKGEDPYHFQEHIYDSELSRKIRSYDDSFFNDKSLVLVLVIFPNIDPAKLDNVYVQQDDLIVEIARPEMNSYMDALSHHAFVIEVDKNSVKNKCAKLSIVRKGVAEDYLDENGKYNWQY